MGLDDLKEAGDVELVMSTGCTMQFGAVVRINYRLRDMGYGSGGRCSVNTGVPFMSSPTTTTCTVTPVTPVSSVGDEETTKKRLAEEKKAADAAAAAEKKKKDEQEHLEGRLDEDVVIGKTYTIRDLLLRRIRGLSNLHYERYNGEKPLCSLGYIRYQNCVENYVILITRLADAHSNQAGFIVDARQEVRVVYDADNHWFVIKPVVVQA